MGMFLSLSSVIGKNQEEVIKSLRKYAQSANGGLELQSLSLNHGNCAVIGESNGNTTIYNPNAFLDWDESSAFISKDLNAPVFSFHIHDGDFWMYTLFVNGQPVDHFNPIPDYFDDNVSEEELNAFKGNVQTIARFVLSVDIKNIENYLIRWDLDKENVKAYPDDEFANEDWQLLDFMRKLGLAYPIDNHGKPNGQVYKLWTQNLPLKPDVYGTSINKELKKHWWKFW